MEGKAAATENSSAVRFNQSLHILVIFYVCSFRLSAFKGNNETTKKSAFDDVYDCSVCDFARSFKRESSNPCQCLPAASLTSLQLREYAALSMPLCNLMLSLVPS